MFEGLGGPRITYRDAAGLVASGLSRLENERLEAGDRVLFLLDETVPLALGLLVCGYARLLMLPISPIFSDEHVRMLVTQCGARAVVTSPALTERAGHLGLPVLTCAHWLTARWNGGSTPDADNGDKEPLFAREHVTDALAPLLACAGVELDAPFIIQPTSGSTGVPKLVVRTHRALARYAAYIGDEVLRIIPMSPRMLAINALTHAFAAHMFAVAMRIRATLLLPTHLDFHCTLAEVQSLDPTILPMTPRVLSSLLAQHAKVTDGQSLLGASARLLLSAGGGLAPAVVKRVQDEGVEVIEFYGSSEASLISYARQGAHRPGSVGLPAADVEFRRTPKGELLVRSPGLMAGYYGDSEMTDLTYTEDGYLRTGDMAEVDADGFLHVLGRRRDVFSTPEGTNIFPERLEVGLEACQDFDQVILVGDGKPYLTVHIAVRGDGLAADRSGFLDPTQHAELYAHAAQLLEDFNLHHEAIEGVVAFALYGSRFPTEVYRPISAGKFSKDRPEFLRRFAPHIALLYGDLDRNSAHFVPPGERRFSRRLALVERPQSPTR